jgi:hypothetical protein
MKNTREKLLFHYLRWAETHPQREQITRPEFLQILGEAGASDLISNNNELKRFFDQLETLGLLRAEGKHGKTIAYRIIRPDEDGVKHEPLQPNAFLMRTVLLAYLNDVDLFNFGLVDIERYREMLLKNTNSDEARKISRIAGLITMRRHPLEGMNEAHKTVLMNIADIMNPEEARNMGSLIPASLRIRIPSELPVRYIDVTMYPLELILADERMLLFGIDMERKLRWIPLKWIHHVEESQVNIPLGTYEPNYSDALSLSRTFQPPLLVPVTWPNWAEAPDWKLRFHENIWPTLLDEILPPDLQPEDIDFAERTVTINYPDTAALQRWLASFGHQVEILEPRNYSTNR